MFDMNFKFTSKRSHQTVDYDSHGNSAVWFAWANMMVLLFQWITFQSYAIESEDKHGISRVGASRLGGVTLFDLHRCCIFFGVYSGVIEPEPVFNYIHCFLAFNIVLHEYWFVR